MLELERPRFCRSCESHFFVVLSSLSVFANMFSFSCSGRQVRSASRALLEVLVLYECVYMCVENEGETPCNYKLLNTELPYLRLINHTMIKTITLKIL